LREAGNSSKERLWQMGAQEMTRFRTDMQSSPTPMLLVTAEGQCIDVNRAASEVLGRSREEIQSMRLEDLVAPEIRDIIPARWEALQEAGWQAGSAVLIRPDGERRQIGYVATADIAPGVSLKVWHTGHELATVKAGNGDAPKLSPREVDVLRMLATGADNQEIASELVIGTETVKTHISRIVRKMQARNRTHAVAIALEHGIFELGARA
jgi:PAS domain S-box-containing protein